MGEPTKQASNQTTKQTTKQTNKQTNKPPVEGRPRSNRQASTHARSPPPPPPHTRVSRSPRHIKARRCCRLRHAGTRCTGVTPHTCAAAGGWCFPRASPRPLPADALALARCQWQPQAASGNSAEAATASGNLKLRVEPDGWPGACQWAPGGAGSRPPLRRRRVWAHGALGAGPALTRRRSDRAEDRPLGRGCQWAGSPSAMGP